MFVTDVANAGPLPALTAMVNFAGQRHRLIAHNIANLDTPNFQPLDASPGEFQKALGEAIERRRESGETTQSGDLVFASHKQLEADANGSFRIKPGTPSGGILFHDRNNRDLERTMQSLAENIGMFRLAGDLMRSRITMMREALADRV